MPMRLPRVSTLALGVVPMKDRQSRNVRNLSGVRNSLLLVMLAVLFGFAVSTPHLSAQDAAKTKRKVLLMKEPDYPYVLRNGHFEGQVRLA